MEPFLNENFLLKTNTAKLLFKNHAEEMPIIDYHCHINPQEIADDRKFSNITEIWLQGDHYKWRVMRSNGIPEYLITGNSSDYEKFCAWAKTIPNTLGNPLYHWSHLELKRYFGINEPLTEENASVIYETCNKILSQNDMSVRGIIKKSNVQIICTTDDPCDDLRAHEVIASDPDCTFSVLPGFRPDNILNIHKNQFVSYIRKLADLCCLPITKMSDLRKAISMRVAYFADHGCVLSDQALDPLLFENATEDELDEILRKALNSEPITNQEKAAYQTAILIALAEEYNAKGWVMQIHFGGIRDIVSRMFSSLGSNTGYDAIDDTPSAMNLAHLLDAFDSLSVLPKMVIYPMNSTLNSVVTTIAGCFHTDSAFPSKIQFGSAWWFNDHKLGIEKQLSDLSSTGFLGSFIGMLTDSRSFLSYTRHEYFRRILCNFIGQIVEDGEYPYTPEFLGNLVENISYFNALRFFEFRSLSSAEI
jgi:glucuronate isomerase